MKTTRAFTLIELLVVISIISMLASVVLASIKPIRAQAMDAKRKQEIHSIDLAIQQYIADKGYPPELNGCSAQVPYAGGVLSGCVAVSTDGLSGFPSNQNPSTTWGLLAKQLSPYIPVIPSDPCTGSCLATDGVTPLAYTYMAPAAVQYFSNGSNSSYQLSAVQETGSNVSGSTGVTPFVKMYFNNNPSLTSLTAFPRNTSVTVNWALSPSPQTCLRFVVNGIWVDTNSTNLTSYVASSNGMRISQLTPISTGGITISNFPSGTANGSTKVTLVCGPYSSGYLYSNDLYLLRDSSD